MGRPRVRLRWPLPRLHYPRRRWMGGGLADRRRQHDDCGDLYAPSVVVLAVGRDHLSYRRVALVRRQAIEDRVQRDAGVVDIFPDLFGRAGPGQVDRAVFLVDVAETRAA